MNKIKNLFLSRVKVYLQIFFVTTVIFLDYCLELWRYSPCFTLFNSIVLLPFLFLLAKNYKDRKIFFIGLGIIALAAIPTCYYYLSPFSQLDKMDYIHALYLGVLCSLAWYSIAFLWFLSVNSVVVKKIILGVIIYLLSIPCLIYFSCNYEKFVCLLISTFYNNESIFSDKLLVNVIWKFAFQSIFLGICLFFILKALPTIKVKQECQNYLKMLFIFSLVLILYIFYFLKHRI